MALWKWSMKRLRRFDAGFYRVTNMPNTISSIDQLEYIILRDKHSDQLKEWDKKHGKT